MVEAEDRKSKQTQSENVTRKENKVLGVHEFLKGPGSEW